MSLLFYGENVGSTVGNTTPGIDQGTLRSRQARGQLVGGRHHYTHARLQQHKDNRYY